MALGRGLRWPSYIVLCASLVIATALFGAPIPLPLPARTVLAGALLSLICAAAWLSGLELLRSDPGRRTLVPAMLLIAPVALFSLMPGFGPPEFTDNAHNIFRYAVLTVDVVAVGSGLMLLQDALETSAGVLYARLGFALTIWATPLYLVWSTLLLAGQRASDARRAWALGPWNDWLMSFSDHLLFFGSLLTYAATALFAMALLQARWIGPKAAAAFVSASLVASAGLVVRGMDFPSALAVFAQGYTIPGWIAGIPAVPWFMPCIFGLILIRRAVREAEPSASRH